VKGGCTTFLACALVKKLTDKKHDIIGYPRLVRLNPNIPWKTRGNGAISLKVGKGNGKKIKIGEIENKEIFCYPTSSSKHINKDKLRVFVEDIVDEYAKLEDENTNSGFVLLKEQPSFETYEKTVKEIVSLEETEKFLKASKASYRGYKNSRGIIGATASVAWSSKKDKTFELITYREKEKWGSKRVVDNSSAKKMDKNCFLTFDNYDYKNKHNRLVPSSPCPVLFGIRGDDEKELVAAKSLIESEKVNCWLIFVTNQGTDDHLQRRHVSEIRPYDSVIVEGTVCKLPYTIEGGHVIFKIKDSTGSVDCAAYEPTKQFREVIRKLIIGDILEVYGGVRKKPLTINLEKINVKHLEEQVEKIENPVCPVCGKHMKSKGTNQGFKCKRCGTKSKKPVLREKKRELHIGFYEVPVCARRHLSKPLKRMKK
jgi:tRNA(Ile2)-agmatinylcytidine synthase